MATRRFLPGKSPVHNGRSHPGQRHSAARKRLRQETRRLELATLAAAQGVSIPEYVAYCALEIKALEERRARDLLAQRGRPTYRGSWHDPAYR